MADVFTNSGSNSSNFVVPAPQLQGNFIPGIDDSQMIDGFGVVIPFGGGNTLRKYFDYGIPAEVSQQNTQLNDLTLFPAIGGGITYDLEGLVGPQGIPGRDGIDGIIHVMGLNLPQNSNFVSALPHNIDLINALGTAADKMIYTNAYNTFTEFVWTERIPGWEAYAVKESYTTGDSTEFIVRMDDERLAQTFEHNAGFDITSVRLKLWKEGSPGTNLVVSIFATTGSPAKPTGSALVSVNYATANITLTSSPGALYNIPISILGLSADTQYAIVLSPDVADWGNGNWIKWRQDASAGGYANGNGADENNGVWFARTFNYMFEIYGSTLVGGTDKVWRAAASNSDGSRLIVGASSGRVYTSDDSGVTWVERYPAGAVDDDWEQAASSSDGADLIVSSSLGRIYTSDDYGVTWTERDPKGTGGRGYWDAVDSDSDGSHLIAGDFGPGRLWTSADSGASWTERRPHGNDLNYSWWGARSDSDGSNLIVAAGFNSLWTSADSGASWTLRAPVADRSWTAVASDADGSHLIAMENTNGRLYTSDDSGATWTERQPAGDVNRDWLEAVSDSDGSHLMVAVRTGRLYTSEDYGVTWTEERPAGDADKDWHAMASDSDGSNLIAGVSSGRLYTGILTTLYSEATWAESGLTSAGRAILDDATVADQTTTLGLGTGDSPTFTGLTLTSIGAEGSDVDKFLVDSTGVIKYRTGDQVLSDIGASASAHLHDTQTLQHDAVNSDGGAFSFTTTGLVTFNQSIAAANYAAANLLTAAATNAGELDFTAASKKLDVEDNAVVSQDYSSNASPTFAGLTLTGLTDDSLIYPSSSVLTSLGVAANGQLPIGSTGTTPVLATISGTTDHISVSNGAGSITIDLDTNTKTLLGSFNGIFLEKLDFTVSEAATVVTGYLEQDDGGDLTQKFSDGYTTLDCTPPLEITLTSYVGTNAVPKVVFVYILQSAKTVIAASNSDWPATEHIKIARLILKSAAATGTDGGALGNQNWNDYAFDATGEGHILDVEHRLRQEPAQYESGGALTLKNSAGAALTTGNSSTAVELVISEAKIFQLHIQTFPALDMYSSGDDAHIANQVVDSGGAYSSTEDLVSDITRYVDGTDSGEAIGGNKYFNLVIWGIINRDGEVSHLMINLPTGQYTTSANAVADVDGTSTFDIPSAFKGTGFLIARLTFRLTGGGSQWTYVALEDLRGQTPGVSAGVGVSTTDHALLANLTAPADDHPQYILHSLADAANDFLVASGADTFAKKTLAETGAILEGDIVHDNLQSIPANDHIDHTGVTLTAGVGLSGGGDISSNRTFNISKPYLEVMS